MHTYIEAGSSVEELYDMSDAGLAGHWELVLQLLDNKHHNVLTSERYAILEDLSGWKGEGREQSHMDNYKCTCI